MSQALQNLADKLADDTIKTMDALGEDRLFEEVAKVIAASSTTLEEAYLTAVRVRLAERRGRKFLSDHIKKAKAAAAAQSEGA